MPTGKQGPKTWYCPICKIFFNVEKKYKKHMEQHFDDKRCPLCNMKVARFSVHLAIYHINPSKRLLLKRDLAILIKESGDLSILNNPKFKLTHEEKNFIKVLLRNL